MVHQVAENKTLQQQAASTFWLGWWPERLAALLSVAGILLSILDNFHVRRWEVTGSDFKTLYASAWCFNRGLDGYNFSNIAAVFDQNGVVQPHSWFGHAPVYPPFTLALLAPLTLVPMWIAVYGWVILSGVALACAAAALARFAGEEFGLSRPWRLALVVAVVASPLAGFGLSMGNVSVLVAALCIYAVLHQTLDGAWPRAAALAVALLLKPHMAFWVVVPLLLVRSSRPLGRKVCATVAGMAVALYLYATFRTGWGVQFSAFFHMLHGETAGGSMRAGNHELMEVPSQIVSLDSLLGYAGGHGARAAGLVLLVAMAGILAWACLRMRGTTGRLEAVSAWCALGLIATYHRAADGTLLLMMLPLLALRWKADWRSGWAWAVAGLYAAASAGIDYVPMSWMVAHPRFGSAEVFVLYRQAALAFALLAIMLLWSVVRRAEGLGQTRF